MTPTMRRKLFVFLFCSSFKFFQFVSSSVTYYGNEATERRTSGKAWSIQPHGPRVWIDDPFNCDSCPGWGYLQFYHVYIHALDWPAPVNMPKLFLQIWSNSTMVHNYTLKWQKLIVDYRPGKLYKVAPDAGQVVEVDEMDRIGFTSEGTGNSIALDLELDDPQTMSTAHRTYFWLLYRGHFALPVVGQSILVDKNALKGRYSIGIELDNGPPRKSSEVYLGHDLIRRPSSGSFFNPPRVVVDDSVSLVSGRVTAFYFRLAQLTTVTSMQVYIWQKTNTDSYILTYSRNVTFKAGPERTRNVSVSGGPRVDGSHRFGWYVSSGLYFSPSSTGKCRYSLSSPGASFKVGKTYAFEALSWPYVMSFGVIVDQQAQ